MYQMIQEAKNDSLTINVRHAKILFCGASCAGKTSFSRLLRNEEHIKTYKSTPAANSQQVLLSDKVNVVGTNWVSLDSKLETQQLTSRLILKLQSQKSTCEAKSSINDGSSAASNVNLSDTAQPFLYVPSSTQTASEVTYTNSSTELRNSELQEITSETQDSYCCIIQHTFSGI